MKIAILTAIINRKSGSRAPLEIAKALKRLGNKVNIFGYKSGLEPEALNELKKEGVKVSLIKKGFLGPFSLYLKLKKGQFDIISFHGTLGFFLAAYASKIPIVRTYYGVQLDALLDKVFTKKPNLGLRLANKLANFVIVKKEKIVLAGSNQAVAISQYTQKELKDFYNVRSETIYLGAAPASFKRIRKKKGKEEIQILSVSRIVPYKGFHHLIKVFKKLSFKYPNTRLTIIGSSPDRKYLKFLKRKASKNVQIKTNVPDNKLVEAYQQADIYATFDRYMFFGMPILEAATFSLPTVAMARCAALETVKHGKTGFLAKNEIEFEKYLERLIEDAALRKKMGQAAQKASREFSWESLGKKYDKIFRMVAKNKT